jgi:chaperonin cofactor prefoldin
MNLAAINHRIENFSTELRTIEKDREGKLFTYEVKMELDERVSFLEEQIENLVSQKREIIWNQAIAKA